MILKSKMFSYYSYLISNNKAPTIYDIDEKAKNLASWYNQKCFYYENDLLNDEEKKQWLEFTKKIKKFLIIIEWKIIFYDVCKYIKKNNKLPEKYKKWYYEQIEYYEKKKRIMKFNKIRILWKTFIAEDIIIESEKIEKYNIVLNKNKIIIDNFFKKIDKKEKEYYEIFILIENIFIKNEKEHIVLQINFFNKNGVFKNLRYKAKKKNNTYLHYAVNDTEFNNPFKSNFNYEMISNLINEKNNIKIILNEFESYPIIENSNMYTLILNSSLKKDINIYKNYNKKILDELDKIKIENNILLKIYNENVIFDFYFNITDEGICKCGNKVVYNFNDIYEDTCNKNCEKCPYIINDILGEFIKSDNAEKKKIYELFIKYFNHIIKED